MPVYFGPQQYGPETSLQRFFLRSLIKLFVTDLGVRNRKCLDMLGLNESHLYFDEVYSSTNLYPCVNHRTSKKGFILINIRGQELMEGRAPKAYQGFRELLELIQKSLKLPYRLFMMSGGSFSDDKAFVDYLGSEKVESLKVTALPKTLDAKELIDIASNAYGVISMSFHGCILSMIGGAPAIPMESDEYYSYKYADFDRYTGFQNVPIVALKDFDVEKSAGLICKYFDSYDQEITFKQRAKAYVRISAWYEHIVGDVVD